MKVPFQVGLLTGLAALGVWGFVAGRHEAEMEAQREAPMEAPARVSQENGVPVIKLSATERTAADIVVNEVAANVLPLTALVWSGDEIWVYVERSAGEFRKAPVTIKQLTPSGYEVAGLPAQSRVVTQGAQLLLSEEQRGSLHVGEED